MKAVLGTQVIGISVGTTQPLVEIAS